MSGHTPGPWFVSGGIVVDANNNSVADVDVSSAICTEEADTNARLIAAAPEMLAMLKHLFDTGYGASDHVAVEALIAKADGRT